MKICIDPGHGGYDPGAVGPTGLKEKDISLQIALQTGEILEGAGIKVAYTRNSDQVPWPANEEQDLNVRCQKANNTGADLFVSIHLNSGSAKAVGTETYCLQLGGNGEKAAKLVQANLVQSIELPDRGLKTARYYVLRKTDMPAILTEVCFISNPEEEAMVKQSEFITKAVCGIANGIASYFDVALNTSAKLQAAVPGVNIKGVFIPGKIANGHIVAEVAPVLEALGVAYIWDQSTQSVVVK